MQKRAKKAAGLAAFSYISVLFLGVGMLRAAQVSRRTLYGGMPCLASVTQSEDTGVSVSLGGAEWTLHAALPQSPAESRFAEALPPCFLKYLLRLTENADRAADYTAECISGIKDIA